MIHGREPVGLSDLLGIHGIDTERLHVKQGRDGHHIPHPPIDRGFEQACAEMVPGTGMLMVGSVHENGARIGGHATALYKSHADKVYFFDPNAGAYEVARPADFIEAWMAGFHDQNRSVAVEGGGKDGFFMCALTKAGNATD